MEPLRYTRARDLEHALQAGAEGGRFIAGGTTLVDLMKLGVEQPGHVVDINDLPLDRIEPLPGGGLRIGALARNADLARHPAVRRDYAALAQALESGASPQLRNMATTGGNLMQRTRCGYFRDVAMPCNKREPGSGCAALAGHHRMLAVLGTSEHCIASHPSDMSVALAALDARVGIAGRQGERQVPVAGFFLLPGDTPQRETVLQQGELITHVELPPPPPGSRSVYVKLRDRASYEFALASAAVCLSLEHGTVGHLRVALGGVGTRPWRAHETEQALAGQAPDEARLAAAARAALREARPLAGNAFKVELARRCIAHALRLTAAAAES